MVDDTQFFRELARADYRPTLMSASVGKPQVNNFNTRPITTPNNVNNGGASVPFIIFDELYNNAMNVSQTILNRIIQSKVNQMMTAVTMPLEQIMSKGLGL